MFWHPIENRQSLIDHVMLILRDITQQRSYEKILQAEKSHKNARNVRFSELHAADAARTGRFLQQIAAQFPAQLAAGDAITSFLRQLHTWKGEARTLGLKTLAERIHRLEDQMLAVKANPQDSGDLSMFSEIQTELIDYQSLYDEMVIHAAPAKHLGLLSVCLDLFDEARVRLADEGISWGGIKVADTLAHWEQGQIYCRRPSAFAAG